MATITLAPTTVPTSPQSTRHVRVQRQRLGPSQSQPSVFTPDRNPRVPVHTHLQATPLCTYTSTHSNALITFMPPAHILDTILDVLLLSYVQDSNSYRLDACTSQIKVVVSLRTFARTRLVSRVWNLAFVNYVRSRSRAESSSLSSKRGGPYSILATYFKFYPQPHPHHQQALALTARPSLAPTFGYRTNGIGATSGTRVDTVACMRTNGDTGLNQNPKPKDKRTLTLNENEGVRTPSVHTSHIQPGDQKAKNAPIPPVITMTPMDLELELERGIPLATASVLPSLTLPPPLIRLGSASTTSPLSSSSPSSSSSFSSQSSLPKPSLPTPSQPRPRPLSLSDPSLSYVLASAVDCYCADSDFTPSATDVIVIEDRMDVDE